MNWLKISVFGLGLATLAEMSCSSSNNTTPPIILGGSGGNGGTSGAGGAVDTGGTTATGGSTIIDAGVDSVVGDASADSGVGIFTKEGNSAILNAPTTGGLDVTGPTPPAYQTCK
jgi:hypothetical protein